MTRRFWLSFCTPDAPEGESFLGACIVDVSATEAALELERLAEQFPKHRRGAEWIAAALAKAWRRGCNPGGEAATLDITDVPIPEGADVVLYRLMDQAELERRGLA